jgi:hypothetical protein
VAFWEPYSSGVYFAPAQVRLYVGGMWMDDACGVMYQVQDDKTPKFGYNDRQYRAVAMGHTLVQGQLHIEFRFNGYLRAAITRWRASRRDLERLSEKLTDPAYTKPKTLSEWAGQYPDLDPQLLSTDQVFQAVQAAHDRGFPAGQDAAQQAKEVWWKKLKPKREGPGTEDRDPQSNPYLSKRQLVKSLLDKKLWRPGLFSKGFDLMILFGVKDTDDEQDYDPALMKVVRDVHITGESQRIQIDVPDGSRSIREVYTFFAKEIVPGDSK